MRYKGKERKGRGGEREEERNLIKENRKNRRGREKEREKDLNRL